MNNPLGEWFAPHIIERGHDYYVSGRVHKITGKGARYSAVVCGGDDYYVETRMTEAGLVAGMSCNCPYAEQGKIMHEVKPHATER